VKVIVVFLYFRRLESRYTEPKILCFQYLENKEKQTYIYESETKGKTEYEEAWRVHHSPLFPIVLI